MYHPKTARRIGSAPCRRACLRCPGRAACCRCHCPDSSPAGATGQVQIWLQFAETWRFYKPCEYMSEHVLTGFITSLRCPPQICSIPSMRSSSPRSSRRGRGPCRPGRCPCRWPGTGRPPGSLPSCPPSWPGSWPAQTAYFHSVKLQSAKDITSGAAMLCTALQMMQCALQGT